MSDVMLTILKHMSSWFFRGHLIVWEYYDLLSHPAFYDLQQKEINPHSLWSYADEI